MKVFPSSFSNTLVVVTKHDGLSAAGFGVGEAQVRSGAAATGSAHTAAGVPQTTRPPWLRSLPLACKGAQ